MKSILGNPYVSRTFGALMAGVTTYAFGHDIKAAASSAVAFLIYGAAHTTSTATADQLHS